MLLQKLPQWLIKEQLRFTLQGLGARGETGAATWKKRPPEASWGRTKPTALTESDLVAGIVHLSPNSCCVFKAEGLWMTIMSLCHSFPTVKEGND